MEGPAWLPSHVADELQGFGFALALVVKDPIRRNYFGLGQLCLLVHAAGRGQLHALGLGHQVQVHHFALLLGLALVLVAAMLALHRPHGDNRLAALAVLRPANAIWLIQTSDIEAQQYRVLNVAEGEDGIYGVTALQYNSTIYNAIETNNKLLRRDISNLSAKPDTVGDISGSEYIYQDGQNVFSGFDLSWISPRQRVSEFRVDYRIDNDNWKQAHLCRGIR